MCNIATSVRDVHGPMQMRISFGDEVMTLAYADDIALVAKSQIVLEDALSGWKED